MKRILVALFSLAVLGASSVVFAVSDGHYDPARQHCLGSDNNSDRPDYANPECHSLWFSLSDGSGHEYFGVGPRMTPEGQFPNTVDVWIDLGLGTQKRYWIDRSGIHGPVKVPGTPTRKWTGLRLYFGADDQLDGGEHDSSEYVNNGPSDGGAIELNVSKKKAFATWVASLSELSSFLENPIPVASAGMGSCADGVCLSMTTHRRVAYQGGDPTTHRSVANYEGVEWDPVDCAGPSDGSNGNGRCSSPAHPDWTLGDWHAHRGTAYVDPGFQFFEDPDPQASPAVFDFVGIPAADPYPLPAIYVGTCGVILGGGPTMTLRPGPGINSAGQFVLSTGCS